MRTALIATLLFVLEAVSTMSSGTLDLRADCDLNVGTTHIRSGDKTLSVVADSDLCMKKYWDGIAYINDKNFEEGKDTLESFIEQCYSLPNSWSAFAEISTAVTGISKQQEWLNLRNWLFKVLYLNPDTNYFCYDVAQMGPTFNYAIGDRGDDLRGLMAVEEYILQAGKCPILKNEYTNSLKSQWQRIYGKWQDTVKDSLLTPFDSTLPSLQEIGFQILLGPQYAMEHNGIVPATVLGSLSASPNPFNDGVAVGYELNIPATLTVEVFDALGVRRQVPVASVFTANGKYTLSLGSSLSSGAYYVRFAVPEGEVKTVKIVKN